KKKQQKKKRRRNNFIIYKKVSTLSLAIGDIITLNVGNIANGGHFIGRHNNQIIFVRHSLTNEKVNVKITAVNSKFAFGDAIEILKKSKDRVNAPCKYAHPEGCGGCDFQHIDPIAQLNFKKIVIKDQFKRIANIEINPEIISKDSLKGLNWRTRLNLAISENKKLGLRVHKSNKIVEIDECLIAVEEINKSEIFNKKWENEDNIKISYSSENDMNISQLGKNISGSDKLKEVVDDNKYYISPKSFWQSHKNAPHFILEQVLKFANIKEGERICDLYGGVGLFTLPISKILGDNGEVHLIEMNRTCIADANEMFADTKNIFIHHGTVEQKLGSIKKINTIILDPPRNGVSKQVINQMIEKKPQTIIYVSCNPSTLARDTKILIDNNYTLTNVAGLDLFPMTHHIECVASFTKK
ncbi:TRAM domain-containing protein, partial [Pelagibacteraceae bacterium]|nr:TRAM domain-containing protein [Pelagibacteraceae bacterium]